MSVHSRWKSRTAMCYIRTPWKRIRVADGDRRLAQGEPLQVIGTDVILVAEAEEGYAQLLPILGRRQLRWRWYRRPEQVLDALENESVDPALVLVEVRSAGGVQSLELCQQLLACRPSARVILVTVERDYDLAIAALRCGAFDVLERPIATGEFEQSMTRALRTHTMSEKLERLRLALSEAGGFAELIGVSQPMQNLYQLMERAAKTRASVLVTGESGTGKELVARALHRYSPRSDKPFVAVNCSAIPENLIESELFGHVKGAFTDARVARPGLFTEADGGTIFLDEIGDMPMSVQPKLLRALQERHVRPVGGDREVAIDVRVIAATNINLEMAVSERRFREDLFYRINVIHIDLPPLRERASDVLLIAQHFVEHYALHGDKSVLGISPEAAEKLLAYSWPGNIRELQNCIERAVSLTAHAEIQVEDLPAKIANFRPSHVLVVSNNPSELLSMEEVERRYIQRVLSTVQGNKREAARVLGFDRKTLYRKLQRYGIHIDRANPD